MNRIAVTRLMLGGKERHVFAALDEKRKLQDLEILTEEDSLLDCICVGRVENIVKNIRAAFVRIDADTLAYLPLDKQTAPIFTAKRSGKPEICVGDELLVQVIKEPLKTKEAVLSTSLTLHGSYCLLSTGDRSFSVSHKIEKGRAKELHDYMVQEALKAVGGAEEKREEVFAETETEDPAGKTVQEKGNAGKDRQDQKPENGFTFGLLARTDAAMIPDDAFCEDVRRVIADYQKLVSQAQYRKAPASLYRNPSAIVQKMKTVAPDTYDVLCTDQPDTLQELAEIFPNLLKEGKLQAYNDEKLPLAVLYGLEGQIGKLQQKQVWLRSGANLIIEQLETLTFIDVNTAKNIAGKKDITLAVNLEAMKEIVLQIRLRNISGMILIDFINMKAEEEQTLIRALKKEIAADPVTCSFADITKLGLVELTRRKVHRSLREQLQ